MSKDIIKELQESKLKRQEELKSSIAEANELAMLVDGHDNALAGWQSKHLGLAQEIGVGLVGLKLSVMTLAPLLLVLQLRAKEGVIINTFKFLLTRLKNFAIP